VDGIKDQTDGIEDKVNWFRDQTSEIADQFLIFLFPFFFLVFVTQFPEDQDLYVGKSQIVLCSAEGYPKPTFKWYKNFKLVKFDQDSRFTLLSNGSMLINPVHEQDTGSYICRITQLGDKQGTSLREQQKAITVTAYGKMYF